MYIYFFNYEFIYNFTLHPFISSFLSFFVFFSLSLLQLLNLFFNIFISNIFLWWSLISFNFFFSHSLSLLLLTIITFLYLEIPTHNWNTPTVQYILLFRLIILTSVFIFIHSTYFCSVILVNIYKFNFLFYFYLYLYEIQWLIFTVIFCFFGTNIYIRICNYCFIDIVIRLLLY